MHHDKKPPIGRAIMRFWCLLGLSFISEIGYSRAGSDQSVSYPQALK